MELIKTGVDKLVTIYNTDKINTKNADVKRAELVDDILDRCEAGYGVKMSADEFLREIRTW